MTNASLLFRRFLASIIDSFLLIGLILLTIYCSFKKQELLYSIGIDGGHIGAVIILILIPLSIINIICLDGTYFQGSLGKIICRLKIVALVSKESEQTRPILFHEGIVRNFIKVLCIQFFFPIALMPIFTQRQQGVHDFIFNTIVVDKIKNENKKFNSSLEVN